MLRIALLLILQGISAYGTLPTDCRNQTWVSAGGELPIMSWHIHYTTNSSDFKRFYEGFVAEFQSFFPPSSDGNECAFGPNYGGPDFKYICSLESALEEEFTLHFFPPSGGTPWTVSQRAFFIPVKYQEKAWAWAQANRGGVDIILHGNTGCMHDDHSVRANWVTYQNHTAPTINTKNFPCNVPGTGCIDSKYSGPPSCGCSTPLKDDAPADSCKNCIADGGGPLSFDITV